MDTQTPPPPEHHLTAMLRTHLSRIEHMVAGEHRIEPDQFHCPGWLRKTAGEPRLPVSLAVVVAIVLQAMLPERYAIKPHLLLPGLELALLAALIIANPHRICRESRVLRTAGLTLATAISVANLYSAAHLVDALMAGTSRESARALLLTGGAIWGTNVIVFALWYWEFDRGGPVARALARKPYPDFQFVQMSCPELAPPDWEPTFADYLYLSFTNATAFSPTDVLPLSRWAKMAMMTQSAISLGTVALVIARAVNILK